VNGFELWKTDGTVAGTVLVKDINPPATGANSVPHGFTELNGALYFRATTSDVNGYRLWKTDGTTAGTVLVKDINPLDTRAISYPVVFTRLNGALYFHADDGVNGIELWKTDGTAAGTQLLKDICPGTCSGPAGF